MNKLQLIQYLKEQGFSSQILKAFSKVSRENFIPKEHKALAYENIALSIGNNQTISQPYTIAKMLELLNLKENQKVLEIGSGCGYVLALISEITKSKVYGIEIINELAEKSKENLKGYNVEVFNRNGSNGLEEKAPFDRILISAAIVQIPRVILNQLKDKGICVAPIGIPRVEQSLTAIQRKGNNFFVKEKIPGFIFVQFVNK